MNWIPKVKALDELVRLLKKSTVSSNESQKDIYQKIIEYSMNEDFTNYLLFILNDDTQEEDVRQISALTLKGILEKSLKDIGEDQINYFKLNVFSSFLNKNLNIRKAISNLVNTFLQIRGIESWLEVLDILYDNLDNDISVTMCLSTLNIIIEDSGNIIQDKYSYFVKKLAEKLLRYINAVIDTGKIDEEYNHDLLLLVMTTLYIILEKCSDISYDFIDDVANTLIQMTKCRSFPLRYRVGRCWLSVITIKPLLFDEFSERLFQFFTDNLSVESYQMNFTAAEFYLCIVEEENGILSNPSIMNFLQANIRKLLPFLLHFTRLTPNDISGVDTENKTFANTNMKRSSYLNVDLEGEIEEEIFEEDSESYNPNWTLRKCCSKIIDKLSNIFHEDVIDTLKPYLEIDMQHQDWKIKERSILSLGAIAIGSYDYLKQDLTGLMNYIILQLSDNNKFIRAISCWTLSRFTNFLIQGDENLFKEYLRELLKRFLDKEAIVHESSCAAFNLLVISADNRKLEPYILDILKIISSVFIQYNDSSLIALYETITLLSENFEVEFTSPEIISDLLISILKKWYEMIKTCTDSGNEILLKVENLELFDLLCSVLKVSSQLLEGYFHDFLIVSLDLIDRNLNDNEIVSKCLEFISILCQVFPEHIKSHPMKDKLVDKLIEFQTINNNSKEDSLNQVIFALIEEICNVDTNLLKKHIDYVIQLLVDHLYLPESGRRKTKPEKILVCNDSCWSLGLISLTFPDKIREVSDIIMERLVGILNKPRMNITLAQNISLCIGRLSLTCPEIVANYMTNFVKQFCLSLKTMKNSIEKQQAFNGICKAIVTNPGGLLCHFSFFCDAICQYTDAPSALEEVFRNILLSYQDLLRESWIELCQSFPDKVQKKLLVRFPEVVSS